MKKSILFGLSVLVLAFAMMVVACDNDTTTNGADDWSDITSLSQVNGTWKGSLTESETVDGITITQTVEITLIINASATTASGSLSITWSFAGAGIAEAWEGIKVDFEGMDDDLTFNDSNHSITYTETIPSTPFTMADVAGWQINGNGTQIRGTIDEEFGVMTLTKQ